MSIRVASDSDAMYRRDRRELLISVTPDSLNDNIRAL